MGTKQLESPHGHALIVLTVFPHADIGGVMGIQQKVELFLHGVVEKAHGLVSE
jgi:hypothetical protein